VRTAISKNPAAMSPRLGHWREGRPRVIVVATDWSARGDRPLDRAIQLAHYWDALLVIATVVEAPPPDAEWAALEARIKARIFEEMPSRDVRFHIDVGKGDVAASVLAVAAAKNADLIVAGVAHYDHVAEYVLGSAVDQLVRAAAVPVLVVKCRPRNGYARIMVTTDYSPCSAGALDLLPAFPRAEVAVVHARPPEALAFWPHPSAPLPTMEDDRSSDSRRFLADVDPALRVRLHAASIAGAPSDALAALAHERKFDLALVDRHGHGRIGRALIGSTAEKLLSSLPCDVMVVPDCD
jgi:nucleotide-binding universal stress UspA family protein